MFKISVSDKVAKIEDINLPYYKLVPSIKTCDENLKGKAITSNNLYPVVDNSLLLKPRIKEKEFASK